MLRRKRQKIKKYKVNLHCEKCGDTGFIQVEKEKIKCSCTLKKELDSWLDNSSKVALKRKTGVIFNVTNKPPNIVLFINYKLSKFSYMVAKGLVETYFRDGTKTFSYYIISGNSYTDAYVIGEHLKYHKAKELYISLGVDNHNKTLQTTIYNLIVERLANGLKTWILIAKGSDNIADLYGNALAEFLEDRENFDKVLKGSNAR